MRSTSTLPHDVVIVGAGPVGATLALALRDADLAVTVLDARRADASAWGDRSLALSHGARLVLERVGVWGNVASVAGAITPIREIDVSQAGGFGVARLKAHDVALPALGYVVSYRALQGALDVALAQRGIDVRYDCPVASVQGTRAYAAAMLADSRETLLAQLIVVADGGATAIEALPRHRHDYHQSALIAKVWCRAPHEGVAFERFTPEGPAALLPEQDHYALVWTAAPERVESLLAQPEASFITALRARFAPRRSDFVSVADRRSFPLTLQFSSAVAGTRCAAIGNAAQALHPVAAQGLNLGLRDAYTLAEYIGHAPREAIGSDALLERYARARRVDRSAGIAFTHGVLSVFATGSPWLSWPRGVALAVLDALPPVKRAFTRAMLHGLR